MITTASTPRSAPVGARSRDYTSFSELSTYRGCPLRHHFRYVLGLPEPTVSASLVFGRAIHQAVEHHFNELLAGNEPPTLDSLLASTIGPGVKPTAEVSPSAKMMTFRG